MPHWGVMQPARRIFLLWVFFLTANHRFSRVQYSLMTDCTMRMTDYIYDENDPLYDENDRLYAVWNMIHVVWSSLTPGCSMSFLCVSVHCTGDCQTTISFSSTSICFISHLDKKYACYCCFIIFVIFINCDLRRSPYLSVDAQSAIAFWTWRRQHDRKQAAYDRVHMHLRPIVWQQLNMA